MVVTSGQPILDTYKLVKRGWCSFLAVAGSTFFGMAAYGSFKVSAALCDPAAIAAIAGWIPEEFAACVGAFATGAFCAAVSAGLAGESGRSGWQWWKESGVEKREILISQPLGPLNGTFYTGSSVSTYHIDYLKSKLGPHFQNLTSVGIIVPNHVDPLRKRDEAHFFSWTISRENFNTTTFGFHTSFEASVNAFCDHVSNSSTIRKRDDNHEWVSYNLYGLNVAAAELFLMNEKQEVDGDMYGIGNMFTGKTQPCSELQCYNVDNKFCASWGQSSVQGQDSIGVGEVYVEAYGGVDNECDSG